ncbi:MAG: hypothetical protein QQN41_06995 [Nitrosopumilus sp.]
MRRNLVFVALIAILLLNPCFSFSDSTEYVNDFKTEIEKIKDQVTEIRRDQLNYRVEKDLLKEMYSTSVRTINVIITIALVVFGIIGFLGIKDIRNLRSEYADELGKLKKLRDKIETDASKIEDTQEKITTDYVDILKKSEEQSTRIKLLELQDKIEGLIESRTYSRALEYIAIALELDPDNIKVLHQKATCLMKTQNWAASVSLYERINKIDPSDETAIVNLAELNLLIKDFDKYRDFYNKNKVIFDSYSNGWLTKYLMVLEHFQANRNEKMKQLISTYIEEIPTEKEQMLRWIFDEVRNYLKGVPESGEKFLLLEFIKILEGEISKNEINRELL